MVRRRTTFAVPFVLVAGCWSSGDVPAKSTARGVATPADAAERSSDVDPRATGCNPPAPHDPAYAPLLARVVQIREQTPDGLVFEIGWVEERAVDPGSRAVLVDEASGRDIDGILTMMKLGDRRIRCKLPGSHAQLPSTHVRIYPKQP